MAPEEITSASTCPGPTEGSWSISPTINRAAVLGTAFMSACISMTSTMEASSITSRSQFEWIVVAALESSRLGVDFKQPVNGFGFKAGRLGHTLGGAAGWRAIAGAARFLLRECARYL